MDIRESVLAAHGRLSDCSVKFLEYSEKEPGILKRSEFNILDGKAEVGRLQSWPTFINQHSRELLNKAGNGVLNLLKCIPERIFENDVYKMSDYYQVPVDIINIQLDNTNPLQLENLLARADFIFTPSGLKCLEYNVSAYMGGMQVAYWEPLYADIPVISKFLKTYDIKIKYENLISLLLEHLLTYALNVFPPGETEINIAAAFPKYKGNRGRPPTYMNQVYRELLHRKSPGIKGEVIYCNYHDLITSENVLFYKQKKIHVLMEMHHGFVLERILEVFKKGNLCLLNGPITKLLSNKLNLALLSEHENSEKFSPAERDMIQKYIPWTRKITPGNVTYENSQVKMEEFIFSHREKMVIKPPMGMSGADVYIGKNTPPPLWKKVVEKASEQKNWLLQEYVESSNYLYQTGENGCAEHNAAWGVFIFGSRYGGGWVRILLSENENGVINSKQGAEETVVIEVDEPSGPPGRH